MTCSIRYGAKQEMLHTGKRSYLEPVMLNTIKYCVDKALENKNGSQCLGRNGDGSYGCGGLLGMGIRNFSMSPASVNDIYNFVKA